MTSSTARVLLLTCCALLLGRLSAGADTRHWYLAEGSTGLFDEEILLANPNSAPATVNITLLRGPGLTPISIPQITMAPTSRTTVRVNDYVADEPVSARIDASLDIVVERSMYWRDGTRRGGSNSPGVTAAATKWYLAEGATGIFDLFVLIANPDTTNDATVKVTFLRDLGTPVDTQLTVKAGERRTIWVNQDFPALASAAISTLVESLNGVPIVVERSMYFGNTAGPFTGGGHDSAGVTAPSPVWLFAEGFTGSIDPQTHFDTYLLLANPNAADTTAAVTFFTDAGQTFSKTYALPAERRVSLHVNEFEPDAVPGTHPLSNAAFSIKVEAPAGTPILAERAEYWGLGPGNWKEGHDTIGVTQDELAWGFAEGVQDGIDATGIQFDSYYLVSNSTAQDLALRATFMREDGTGIVRTYTVRQHSRFTLSGFDYPELSNQRFAVFLESANGVPFVAERAVYWGAGYTGGHASIGTPWAGAIGTPPPPPAPAITSILPITGTTRGGTTVTITGHDFTQGAQVTLAGVPATNVTVLDATTITAVAGPSAQPGAGDVVVTTRRSGTPSVTLPSAFTYVPPPDPTITGISPASGPTTGGTLVTISGTNFHGALTVTFGGVAASAITRVSDTQVQALTPPHGEGDANVVVTADLDPATAVNGFRYERATATDRILAFGDSITRGVTWDLVTGTNGFSANPYPAVLEGLLRQRYTGQASGLTVQNAGVPGEWAQDGRNRLPGTLQPAQDLVILLEGVNDLNAGFSPAHVRDALRSMVTLAKNAGKLVILSTLTPARDLGPGDPNTRASMTQIAELNARIRLLAADQHVVLVDLFNVFGGDLRYISKDGLHPTDQGYQMMAQAFFDAIVANFETIPPVN